MNDNSLTNLSYIRELMERGGVAFRKEFGQNFLTNPAIPRRIASFAGGNVLEIGPGIGTLTRELSQSAERVLAVEIDGGLIPILGETLRECPNVTVINADIMQLDVAELADGHFGGEAVSVAANLPYNITTPIIMKLLRSRRFSSIVVMVQKEVAQRFTAAPSDTLYGAVTAEIAYFARCERLFDVSAGNFVPRPKVDSAVVRFNIFASPPVEVEDEALLLRVIKGGFAQRRKTLYNSLSSELSELDRAAVAEAIKAAGLPENIRGERLALADFAGIANYLFNYKHC